MKKEQMYKEELTAKEWAFIQTCRRIKTGTIQGLGIVRGEPTTYVVITERVDTSNPDDLERMLTGKALTLSREIEDGPEIESRPHD